MIHKLNSDYNVFVRAQVYEIFMNYYKFESNDYSELSEFIKRDYNVFGIYYEENKAWKDIKETAHLTEEQKTHIKKVQKLIHATFDKLSKMTVDFLNSIYNEYTRDRKEKENKDYKSILGIDKVIFEK